MRTRSQQEIENNRRSARRSYEKDPIGKRAYRLAWRYRTRYGTTPEEVAQKIEQQGNACAICGTSFTEARPCIDHNHRTITPRAILCQRCNVLVGFLESELAPIGQAYIEAWHEE